jgi:hypothetical protein
MKGVYMEITLENVELIVDRTGATYKEAKEALEKTKGNAVDAIIYLEENIIVKPKRVLVKERAQNAASAIKNFVLSGNVNRLVVENKDGEKLLNIPINVSLPGLLLSPIVSTGYIIWIFAAKCKIKLYLKDGNTVDITDKTAKTARGFVVKGKEFAGQAYGKGKDFAGQAYEKGKDIAKNATEKGKDIANEVAKKGKGIVEQTKEKIAPKEDVKA